MLCVLVTFSCFFFFFCSLWVENISAVHNHLIFLSQTLTRNAYHITARDAQTTLPKWLITDRSRLKFMWLKKKCDKGLWEGNQIHVSCMRWDSFSPQTGLFLYVSAGVGFQMWKWDYLFLLFSIIKLWQLLFRISIC